MPACLLRLDAPGPAPGYVTLGPLVFNFTLDPGGEEVDCAVYLDSNLAAYTTLNKTNTPYALAVQDDSDYGRGPITTSVEPSDQISTITGAIHYYANGTDQFYQGLLYYWHTPSS